MKHHLSDNIHRQNQYTFAKKLPVPKKQFVEENKLKRVTIEECTEG